MRNLTISRRRWELLRSQLAMARPALWPRGENASSIGERSWLCCWRSSSIDRTYAASVSSCSGSAALLGRIDCDGGFHSAIITLSPGSFERLLLPPMSKDDRMLLWRLPCRLCMLVRPAAALLGRGGWGGSLMSVIRALLMMASLHPYSMLLMPPMSGWVLRRALQ